MQSVFLTGSAARQRLSEADRELNAVAKFVGPAWDELRRSLETERTKLRDFLHASRPVHSQVHIVTTRIEAAEPKLVKAMEVLDRQKQQLEQIRSSIAQ
eukprot:5438434-Pyramimonas_sp.AAC.1